ncbi:MAG: protease complex subunit PrcB family protein [Bacteroidales bacterium]|jgi:hypothetical protein|nr:protease complex subunit PrcB family protein [Bacteroidales bacterium]
MRKHILYNTAICVLLVGFLLAGCEKDKGKGAGESVNVPFTTIAQGDLFGGGREGFTKQNIIISTATDWENLKTAMPDNMVESFAETDIDFSVYQIIAVFDEVKPNGGWSIDVMSITQVANKIVVTLSNVKTGDDTCVITQPFHIVKIPISQKEIVFQ